MDGKQWEIKSPCGQSKRTIENNLRKAQKQSGYIIFDLRRLKTDELKAVAQIKREFEKRKRNTLRVLIITKSGQLLDIRR